MCDELDYLQPSIREQKAIQGSQRMAGVSRACFDAQLMMMRS
jgi:hypothetical protein